jgi:hypothetical protein
VQPKSTIVYTIKAAIADAKHMYTAGLLNSHAALVQLAAKLRSTNPEEILWLVWQIQSLPSNQDAVEYLLHILH